ncbi:MAG TPA: sulfite oxidase-like oxidoreductase [Anaerolineaceae bacterium]|jgi:DMSO/TMAO reductase YedYZ molybdopterin-dependent catalytic subunit
MFDSIFRRKEDEKKFRQEGRMPPGQSYTQRFPVLHYGPVPDFNPATWDFKVTGEIEKPFQLSWDEFNKLPRTKITMDIHCVTRWSKFDTVWEGVAVQTLIDASLLKLKPQVRFVVEHAEYGYTTNVPLKVVLQPNFLMATHYNGQPLSPDHGYPLRGVVGAIPGRSGLETPYLWKGAKWLRGLEFLSQDQPGFWEQAGYHNNADVWKEERFS